jgi:hypothetical protein
MKYILIPYDRYAQFIKKKQWHEKVHTQKISPKMVSTNITPFTSPQMVHEWHEKVHTQQISPKMVSTNIMPFTSPQMVHQTGTSMIIPPPPRPPNMDIKKWRPTDSTSLKKKKRTIGSLKTNTKKNITVIPSKRKHSSDSVKSSWLRI